MNEKSQELIRKGSIVRMDNKYPWLDWWDDLKGRLLEVDTIEYSPYGKLIHLKDRPDDEILNIDYFAFIKDNDGLALDGQIADYKKRTQMIMCLGSAYYMRTFKFCGAYITVAVPKQKKDIDLDQLMVVGDKCDWIKLNDLDGRVFFNEGWISPKEAGLC